MSAPSAVPPCDIGSTSNSAVSPKAAAAAASVRSNGTHLTHGWGFAPGPKASCPMARTRAAWRISAIVHNSATAAATIAATAGASSLESEVTMACTSRRRSTLWRG